MKNKYIIFIGVLLLGLTGAIVVNIETAASVKNPTQTKIEIKNSEPAMNKDTVGSAMPKQSSRYFVYSAQAFADAVDKKRVFFFHATWCPTCKEANEEFVNNPDGIPEDILVFKTDYDSEKELKKTYGITYQHTFVYVDAQGRELKKWNGGGIAQLTTNTKDN